VVVVKLIASWMQEKETMRGTVVVDGVMVVQEGDDGCGNSEGT